MNEGKLSEACPKLAESYRLDPGLGALLNLATCHEAEGKIATAWAEFTEALSRAKRDADAPRGELAQTKVSALAPRLRRVQIVVSGEANVPGLEVTLDGSRVAPAAWGLPVPVDPGAHEVVASAPGKQRWSERQEAPPEGQTRAIAIPRLADATPTTTAPAVTTPPPPTPAAQQPAPAPASRSRFTPPVIVAASAAGLFTAGAIVTGVLYSSAHEDFEQANEAHADDRADKRATAKTLGVVNLVCLGGAVVSAGVGVVLFATGAPASDGPRTARFELVPTIGPTSATLGARGRF